MVHASEDTTHNSGFNAKLDTSISGVAAYDVSVKNLIVTRGQVIRMYAILIVIAICECLARQRWK